MVNICVNIASGPVPILSVPLDAIRRLSLSPLKWLRFVTFAVCGAHGDLCESARGPVVDYDASFDDIADSYYYLHQGDFIFVGFNGSNDRITSSERTQRRNAFRSDVIARDGENCVITGEAKEGCDAVHIIPHCKGNEYMNRIIQDRSILYESAQDREVSEIDAVENGIFLRKDLHANFAVGKIAFLRTPNFALSPSDIPRVEAGPTPLNRITLQYLVPPVGRSSTPPFDVFCTGTGYPAPPAILLDYIYGIAAYKEWKGGPEVEVVMQKYFSLHYRSIPILRRDGALSHGMDSDESDDTRDPDWSPPTPPMQGQHDSHLWDGMLQAMDEMNFRIMSLKGITPQAWAAEKQKKEEEERGASRNKVLD